jgi:acyl-CoA hydrolase
MNKELKIIEPVLATTMRLVKSEDLNHHGTLFAGRTAEWFVESGFIAAARILNPQNIVCLKIHGLTFTQPVKPGEIIIFESKIILAGRSSLVAHVKAIRNSAVEPFVKGFITFIYVDENTKPKAHLIEIKPVSQEDSELFEEAKKLKVK